MSEWHNPLSRYTVNFTRAALEELNKLNKPLRHRILAVITVLEEKSRPDGVKKLAVDENAGRIRIGDYRVLYEIHDGKPVWIRAIEPPKSTVAARFMVLSSGERHVGHRRGCYRLL